MMHKYREEKEMTACAGMGQGTFTSGRFGGELRDDGVRYVRFWAELSS